MPKMTIVKPTFIEFIGTSDDMKTITFQVLFKTS